MALNISINASGATTGAKAAVSALKDIQLQAKLTAAAVRNVEKSLFNISQMANATGSSFQQMANTTKTSSRQFISAQEKNTEAVAKGLRTQQEALRGVGQEKKYFQDRVAAKTKDTQATNQSTQATMKNTRMHDDAVKAQQAGIMTREKGLVLANKEDSHLNNRLSNMKAEGRLRQQSQINNVKENEFRNKAVGLQSEQNKINAQGIALASKDEKHIQNRIKNRATDNEVTARGTVLASQDTRIRNQLVNAKKAEMDIASRALRQSQKSEEVTKRNIRNTKENIRTTATATDQYGRSAEGVERLTSAKMRDAQADAEKTKRLRASEPYVKKNLENMYSQKQMQGMVNAQYLKSGQAQQFEEDKMKRNMIMKKKMTDELAKTDKRFNAATSSLTKYTMLITSLSASYLVLSQILQTVSRVVGIGIQFERNMAVVKAVSRASIGEFKLLKEAAREAGETTVWTASQAAEALKFLAMAGFTAQESMTALSGVLRLALIGQMDLGQATDIVTDTLNAMKLKVKDLARVNDVFVGTVTRTNTDVRKMGEAMKYAAPVAGELGYSIEQVSAMIGVLSQSGIKAGIAGRGLQTSMIRTAKAARILGIDIESDLITVIDKMIKKQTTVTEIQQIFGLRALKTVLVLKSQREAYDKLHDSLKKASGESAEFSKIYGGTVGGALKRVQSILSEQVIGVFEDYRFQLKNVFFDLTRWIKDHSNEIRSFFRDIVDLGTQIGTSTITAIKNLSKAVKGFTEVIPEGYGDVATYGIIGRLFFGSWGPLKYAMIFQLMLDAAKLLEREFEISEKTGITFHEPIKGIEKAINSFVDAIKDMVASFKKIPGFLTGRIEIGGKELTPRGIEYEKTKPPFGAKYRREYLRLQEIEDEKKFRVDAMVKLGKKTHIPDAEMKQIMQETIDRNREVFAKEVEELKKIISKKGIWDLPEKGLYEIVKVLDADTVRVKRVLNEVTGELSKATEDVRTAGIDAFESANKKLFKNLPIGMAWSQAMKEVLKEGTRVRMDFYGRGVWQRLIGDIYLEENKKLVNVATDILSMGGATVYEDVFSHPKFLEAYKKTFASGAMKEYIASPQQMFPKTDWFVTQEADPEAYKTITENQGKEWGEYFSKARESYHIAINLMESVSHYSQMSGKNILEALKREKDAMSSRAEVEGQINDLILEEVAKLEKADFMEKEPILQQKLAMEKFRKSLEVPIEAYYAILKKEFYGEKLAGKELWSEKTAPTFAEARETSNAWGKAVMDAYKGVYEARGKVMNDMEVFKAKIGADLPEDFKSDFDKLTAEYDKRMTAAFTSGPGGKPSPGAYKVIEDWIQGSYKTLQKMTELRLEINRQEDKFESKHYILLKTTSDKFKKLIADKDAGIEAAGNNLVNKMKVIQDYLSGYKRLVNEIEGIQKGAVRINEEVGKQIDLFKMTAKDSWTLDETFKQLKAIDLEYEKLVTKAGKSPDLQRQAATWKQSQVKIVLGAEKLVQEIQERLNVLKNVSKDISTDVQTQIDKTIETFLGQLEKLPAGIGAYSALLKTFVSTLRTIIQTYTQKEIKGPMGIDELRAMQTLYKEMEKYRGRNYANEVAILKKQYEAYDKLITDKDLLNEWYAFRMRELLKQELVEYGGFIGGIKSYLMEMQDAYKNVYRIIGETTKRAMNDIYGTIEDTFFFAFKSDMDSISKAWTKLWSDLRDYFFRVLAQMAARAILNPIIVRIMGGVFGGGGGLTGIVGSGLGGTATGVSGVGAMGMSPGNLVSLGSQMVPKSVMEGFLPEWATSWLSTPAWGAPTGLAGVGAMSGPGAAGVGAGIAAPTFGALLGAGGLGALGYTMLGPLLGLPQGKYSGIGAGLGAAGGYALGGLAGGAMGGVGIGATIGSALPVIGTIAGAILGGIIGSLFGNKGENTYTMEAVNMLINRGSLTPLDPAWKGAAGTKWQTGEGLPIFEQAPAFGSYGMTTPQNAGTAAWFYPASDVFRQARNQSVEQFNEHVMDWLDSVPDSLRDQVEGMIGELDFTYGLSQRIPISATGEKATEFAQEYYDWMLDKVNAVIESDEVAAMIEIEMKKALYEQFINPIIDLLNQLTMTDFEYNIHKLTETYDLKIEELLALDLNEEQFNEGLNLLTQAFALQAKNLMGASTLIDDFITEMTLSELAPVQSVEAFRNQFDTLLSGTETGGTQDIEKLLGYISGDYLPFMQQYFGDETGYQNLWDQLMGPEGTLRGLEETSILNTEEYVTNIVDALVKAIEEADINVDMEKLTASIIDAFAGNLEGRGNEDRPLQLVIDGQVIAEVIINQSMTNPELQYVIKKIAAP